MRDGVLVMAYGTPERIEDVAAYYTHIRRGSPPPPELLAELVERYRAIGGPTELNRITRRQAERLAAELAGRGHDVAVEVGFKHVPPFVGDAVRRLADAGAVRITGLVLAPHFSTRSVAEYEAAALDARPPGVSLDVIASWHDEPLLIEALTARLARTLQELDEPLVLFTAHSIPARAIDKGDPYPLQLLETSRLVAGGAGSPRWGFAWQSAGRTGEPWLGPDVTDAIAAAARDGERAVAVHAIGFVADHLETLYDLDVEARAAAARHGLAFARVPMPNDDPDFVAALAAVVARRLEAAG